MPPRTFLLLIAIALAAGCGQPPPPQVRPGAGEGQIFAPPVRHAMQIEERDEMGPVDVFLDGGEQAFLKGVYLVRPTVSIGGERFLKFASEGQPPGRPVPLDPAEQEARRAWYRAIRYVNASKIVWLKDSEEKKPDGGK